MPSSSFKPGDHAIYKGRLWKVKTVNKNGTLVLDQVKKPVKEAMCKPVTIIYAKDAKVDK